MAKKIQFSARLSRGQSGIHSDGRDCGTVKQLGTEIIRLSDCNGTVTKMIFSYRKALTNTIDIVEIWLKIILFSNQNLFSNNTGGKQSSLKS